VQLFAETMHALDKEMGRRKKRIMLVMDNASSHKVAGVVAQERHGFMTLQMDWVLIVFLPANTTSIVQPLDQGIINSFKAHYKQLQITWYLKMLDANSELKDVSQLRCSVSQVSIWHLFLCPLLGT
jgi:hypothetical protein